MNTRFLAVLALAAIMVAVPGWMRPPSQTSPMAFNTFNISAAFAQTKDKAASKLSGMIKIDGSSTVYPISEAMAEEFQIKNPGVKVTVGISGTGGGFKKFCAGDIAISNASRPIKQSEKDLASSNGIHFVELPVAFDGLSVVVNPKNTWVDKLTVAELKAIWEPGSKINNWSQVRKGFPDVPLKLYAPGADSGTFEYFTEAIVGTARSSRSDFTASEDDNILVRGVAGDKGGLGYFGYAYYEENSSRLKLVPIDNGQGAVKPSPQTIANGSYSPLARPIFIYVNTKDAKRPEVDAFVKFCLNSAPRLVKEVGYVALPTAAYEAVKARYNSRRTGSAFSGKNTIGLTIEDVLKAES